MGSQQNGKQPENKVTISRGGDVPSRKVNPETGKTDRSFAQPSPVVAHPQPTPKAHASEEDAREALAKHSKLGKGKPQKRDEDDAADGADRE